MTNEDVKKVLIDLLSEESVQVLQVAYIYAKHYVDYGEDITKAFSNAVVQASMLQKVRQKAFVEAYDSFKKNYEASLKADMVAMLTDLKSEIAELKSYESEDGQDLVMLADIGILFQQKEELLEIFDKCKEE